MKNVSELQQLHEYITEMISVIHNYMNYYDLNKKGISSVKIVK